MNPVCDFTYRNPTHAVHLHDYPASVRVDLRDYSIRPGDLTCIQSSGAYSISSAAPGKHGCIHYYDDPVSGEQSIELPCR